MSICESKERETMSLTRSVRLCQGVWRLVFLAVASVLCISLVPVSASAASTESPVWSFAYASAYPTNFAPGSESSGYSFSITNEGSGPTSGLFTLSNTLPPGISYVAGETWEVGAREGLFAEVPLSCEAQGQTLTCEGTVALYPGQRIAATIPVEVPASTSEGELSGDIASIEGGGAALVSAEVPTVVSSTPVGFGLLPGAAGLNEAATNGDGSLATQAGSHPNTLRVQLNYGWEQNVNLGLGVPDGGIHDIEATLPKGTVVDPQAVPTCTEQQLESHTFGHGGCPDTSQVGLLLANISLSSFPGPTIVPLYNMVPPPGQAAEFGFEILEGVYVHLLGKVLSNGKYRLAADVNSIPAKVGFLGADVFLWGDPTDESHDAVRGECHEIVGQCPAERLDTAFVTMPSSCQEGGVLSARTDSWVHPGIFSEGAFATAAPSGCSRLEFAPTISSQPSTNVADSPSGLNFDLHVPQSEGFEGLATANLKKTKVVLPEGMPVNPAAASGRTGCSEAQFAVNSAAPSSCPDSSKIGSVEVDTPLLDHPLPGSVYLAQPYTNQFGSLLAIYIAVDDPQTGVVLKLPGKVDADPVTGRLTATFEENPELPFEDLRLEFFNGARAALTTPLTCGTKTTTSVLTPWSTPEGADATPTDSFQTQVAAGGSGTCPSSEANAPNAPAFTAGTIAPQAGAYSPFVLRLVRTDGTQRLTAIDTTLPKGLAAKFAGITYCSEAQIAQAQARSNPNQGALEQQSPSCPAASEVGTVTVGAGSGPTPLYVSGHAYLAGPYKGAPLSLAIITPAVAGPFDLGTVLVRTALYINPETAQGRAVSDPLPSILQGIPLDIRSIAVKLGRPDFTLNPTSCDPMAITGAATALSGQSAALTSPFQVGGCSALKFKPKLKISLKGGTKRHRFPALKAVLTYPKGNYANIASAQVTLPHSAFLEQGHIGTVCTRVQFAADACPKASIYGKAKAITPLFDKPLEGPVYLRSSSHELPDLVAALNGQIDVDLVGRIDTGKGGGIRNTFEAVPDAPVSKFVLEMKGGKKGLLVNSEDICRKPQRAQVSFTGQNGKVSDATPLIANSCGGKAKKKGSKKGSGGKKGGKGK
jgi:hypothetical protein